MRKSDGNMEGVEKQAVEKRRISTLWYLIISFVCAVSLWFFVADYNTITTKTFNNVPVELLLPENTSLTVESVNVSYVNITVYGRKADINAAKVEDFYAYVDASSSVSDGQFDLALDVVLPTGLTLAEENALSVTDVEVVFAKTTKKNIEITEFEAIGSWNEEYWLEPLYNPSSITVEGSNSIISQIEKAKVVLDVGVLERPKEVRTEVILLDKEGNEISPTKNHLKLSERYVNVYVKMNMKKELPLKVEFSGNILNAETDATYKIDPPFVMVSGSTTELSKMEYIPIVIDEHDIENKSYVGVVSLPDLSDKSLEYEGIESTSVSVDVTLRDFLTTNVILNIDDIEALGLDAGLKANFAFVPDNSTSESPTSISVTFRGYSDSIKELRKLGVDALTCVVDFTGFDAAAGQSFVNIAVNITSKQPGVWTTAKISVNAVIEEDASLEESGVASELSAEDMGVEP